MFGKRLVLTASSLKLLLSAPLIIVALMAHAQTEKVLYSFSGSPGDGQGPTIRKTKIISRKQRAVVQRTFPGNRSLGVRARSLIVGNGLISGSSRVQTC
jgi:hypothetical protein